MGTTRSTDGPRRNGNVGRGRGGGGGGGERGSIEPMSSCSSAGLVGNIESFTLLFCTHSMRCRVVMGGEVTSLDKQNSQTSEATEPSILTGLTTILTIRRLFRYGWVCTRGDSSVCSRAVTWIYNVNDLVPDQTAQPPRPNSEEQRAQRKRIEKNAH